MKIQDTKGFVLIAKCIKNTKQSKALIRFDYSVCKDKQLIKKRGGRVYLICVNDEIYKIGYSIDKNGMKGTLGFYQGAMAGKPSIRSYGIHKLINKELEKSKNVSVYVKYSKKIKIDSLIIGLNKEHSIQVSPSKEFEDICKKDYYEFEEIKYPKWNFQENGKQWPKDIQLSHNQHGKKQIDKRKK